TGVFVQTSYNVRRFTDSTYDSHGIRAVGGVAFAASRLIQGEASAGLLLQEFHSALLEDLGTWTFGAKLAWQPSPLVTISLEGTREADQSSFGGGSSTVDNDIALRADYELRRNIIVSAMLDYKLEDYQGGRLDTTKRAGGALR